MLTAHKRVADADLRSAIFIAASPADHQITSSERRKQAARRETLASLNTTICDVLMMLIFGRSRGAVCSVALQLQLQLWSGKCGT